MKKNKLIDFRITSAIAGVMAGLTTEVSAANRAFDGDSNFEWTTAANWTGNSLPGANDTADFRDSALPGSGAVTINVSSAAGPIQNLRFGATVSSVDNPLTRNITISGNSIAVTGAGNGNGITYQGYSTGSVVINSGIVIGGDLEFAINEPASGSNFVTINGVISQTGGTRAFVKSQDGRLAITNTSNSFSGNVEIRNGILAVPDFSALGTGSAILFGSATNAVNAVGRLAYTADADATLSRTLTLQSGGNGGGRINNEGTGVLTISSGVTGTGRFVVAGSGDTVVNGKLSQTKEFNKLGAGKVTLSNTANNFAGNVGIENGTLAVANFSALGAGTGVSFGDTGSNNVGILSYTANPDATFSKAITLTTNGNGGGRITNGGTGALTVTSNVSGSGHFGIGGSGTTTVSGVLSQTAGFRKVDSGQAVLTNPLNTYSGTTLVRNGSITVTTNGALGNSTEITLADSESNANANPAFLTNGAVSVAANITANDKNSGGTSTVGGSSFQVTENSAFQGNILLKRELRLASSTDTAHAVTFVGQITDGTDVFGIRKVGTGTVILTGGSNDYDGATSVDTGRLLVNGTHTSTNGSFAVASGATLGGTGSIAGDINVNAGGKLAPGASIGTLSVGSATISGSLATELDGAGSGSADRLAAGALVLGSTASLDFTVLSPLDDQAYVFATYTSLNNSAFNTQNITGVPAGYEVNFNYNGNNQIAVVAVPEPTLLGAAGAGLVGLGLARRRRSLPG